MSDAKSWIEERRAIIHGAREAIRPAEAIDLGLIDLPRALDALDKVLEPHGLNLDFDGTPYCKGCSIPYEVTTTWPCPTIQAIEGAIDE